MTTTTTEDHETVRVTEKKYYYTFAFKLVSNFELEHCASFLIHIFGVGVGERIFLVLSPLFLFGGICLYSSYLDYTNILRAFVILSQSILRLGESYTIQCNAST